MRLIRSLIKVSSVLIIVFFMLLSDQVCYAKKLTDAELKQYIQNAASSLNHNPIDAKIDSIWKAIPGLEGTMVNEKATFKAMKEHNSLSKKHIVIKCVAPKVHLHSLPAAPIYRGLEEKKMVAFTINVAWGEEHLKNILATLKKHNIHATFFLEGKWTEKNKQLAKQLVVEGHEIGNHSYSHADMKLVSTEKMKEELEKANKAIKEATGKIPTLFAPPSGSFRDETISLAKSYGMFTTLWTVDTIDWQQPHPSVIVDRIENKLHSGAIVLMHPTKPTSEALDECIEYIHSKGLSIGTVSDLISEKREK